MSDPRIHQRRTRRRVLAGAVAATLGLGTIAATGPASGATTPAVTHYTGSLADGASWVGDMPADWNGVLLLYSHGYGNLTATDAPDPTTKADLLADGYALVGSSYSGDSLWALASATSDQFGALAALRKKIARPRQTLAFGTSMGGLVSAQEAQRANGRIDGALTTCGLVGGAVNLNNYQLDGEYAIARLLAPGQHVKLVDYADASEANAAAARLAAAVQRAQRTPAGRARIALAAALLNTPDWQTGTAPPRDYAEQERQEAAWLPEQLAFVMGARPSIEAAAGGNGSWTAGVDYGRLVHRSVFYRQIATLYRRAGLSLGADVRNLTRHADIRPDRSALRTLTRTSTVTGHLDVPELDLHTLSDQLSPIAFENWYAGQVRRSGSGHLLRQAYVQAIGHCDFTSAELVAGVQAVRHRVATGHWGDTGPAALNRAASATGFGSSAFIAYRPPRFVNARHYRPRGWHHR